MCRIKLVGSCGFICKRQEGSSVATLNTGISSSGGGKQSYRPSLGEHGGENNQSARVENLVA